MRIYILRALVNKEFMRHCANRGGLALAFLLVAAAVLLSVFNPGGVTGGEGSGTGMVGGVHTCYIEFPHESSLIAHLRKTRPENLKVFFRDRSHFPPQELVKYGPGVGGIHLRISRSPDSSREMLVVQIWHPKDDPQSMAPYEQWFLRETRRHFQEYAV